MNFKTLREGYIVKSAWVKYPTRISYMDIGHMMGEIPSNTDSRGLRDPEDGAIWFYTKAVGIEIISLEDSYNDETGYRGHSGIEDYSGAIMSGRIDHKKKMISFSIDDRKVSDIEIFSVAYDLQKKYTKYTILNSSGMKFYGGQHLREKFVKGIDTKYHINPSGFDMLPYIKNTSHKGIRLWTYKGDLYMWDAGYETHSRFAQDEIGGIHYSDIMTDRTGHFYLSTQYSSFMGSDILKNHKQAMDIFFSTVEKEYDIELVKDEFSSSKVYIELSDKVITESVSTKAWRSYLGPVDNYLKVGHYTHSDSEYRPILWRYQGRGFRFRDMDYDNLTHYKAFGRRGPWPQGRIDPQQKIISMIAMNDETGNFEVAFDLQKMYPEYDIIRYDTMQVFKV